MSELTGQLIVETAYNLGRYLELGGVVLVPLIGVSLWMWYLILLKLITLSRHENLRPAAITAGAAFLSDPAQLKSGDPTWDTRLARSMADRYRMELERHVPTIFVLSAIAPLLGLLGTVTGMVATFQSICRIGSTHVPAMASGISEALVTTQAGLTIAIPGMMMGYFIQRRVETRSIRMERYLLSRLGEASA